MKTKMSEVPSKSGLIKKHTVKNTVYIKFIKPCIRERETHGNRFESIQRGMAWCLTGEDGSDGHP